MRIGNAIERSPESGVLHPDMPGAPKTKLKYALLGSAIPLAFLFGRALVTKRRAKLRETSDNVSTTPRPDAAWERYIGLPHGGPGARFRVRELIDLIERSGRDYIIVGEVDCALADHPKPSSLDYWLRGNFAKNKETKQATTEVTTQLVETGLFERLEGLRCPDGGHKCQGLRLKARLGAT